MTDLSQFSDITPVQLNQEEPQLCQILYDDEYKSVMGILLALLAKKEYSDRAFELTQAGIELLASHYTIWNYRYNIIVHLDKNLYDELDWCEQLALDNEKNYQIWNYRQLIIELIISRETSDTVKKFNAYHEFPIVDEMLSQDSKNHHVWSYRKWLVERFKLYRDEREIEFVAKRIEYDVKNNSAWTHRFFIKFGDEQVDQNVINEEIDYVKQKIQEAPQNASSWNYLIGIYQKFKKPDELIDLEEFCQEFANINEENVIKSSYALELLGKINVKKNNKPKAIEIYSLLKDIYDPIRKNYWTYQIKEIEA
ncbi:protein farnesyltransferase/geranylgeranyltransferase type-1 subunit alpha [[Candida] railenensis]|uniref:Protein farnesyltransferase/geranylgeranyltransferase type-1 subunit alpha n=1 Tax=[Candida] railenensis TaxID=45579 RepID=A0A9P0VYR2_9ASCO|nr:protein farnesyltransferase/geranylgeranyltransferase type-1 subunit alpha [[Candida] railenensis]